MIVKLNNKKLKINFIKNIKCKIGGGNGTVHNIQMQKIEADSVQKGVAFCLQELSISFFLCLAKEHIRLFKSIL